MKIQTMPLAMGALMGLMLPWTMHMQGTGSAGLLFILAHLAVVALVGTAILLIPAARRRLASLRQHRPRVRHLPLMALGLAAGWALTCAACLIIGGQHWT